MHFFWVINILIYGLLIMNDGIFIVSRSREKPSIIKRQIRVLKLFEQGLKYCWCSGKVILTYIELGQCYCVLKVLRRAQY